MPYELLMTLPVGTAGALLLKRTGFPAGLMVGSLFAVAILHLTTGLAFMPDQLRIATQIAAGALIGSRIGREDVLRLRRFVFPCILLVFGMIFLNLALGMILHWTAGLDAATALLGTAPGGMADMALVAMGMKANPAIVAALQLIRYVSVVSLAPMVIRFVCSRGGTACAVSPAGTKTKSGPARTAGNGAAAGTAAQAAVEQGPKAQGNAVQGTTAQGNALQGTSWLAACRLHGREWACTFAAAAVGGLVGAALPVPAGAMTFSMLTTAIFRIATGKGAVPKATNPVCQVLAGALVGATFNIPKLNWGVDLLIALVLLILAVLALNVMIGWLISKLSGIDFQTSLFASVPGGLTDMTLIAGEFGADTTFVALMQLMRLLCVLMLFPTLISLVSGVIR